MSSQPDLACAEREPSERSVLEAIRLSPSGHNTQPWRLIERAPAELGLAWDPGRWLRLADPTGEILAQSLGCALESACAVAHIDFEPDPDASWVGDPAEPGCEVGVLRLRSLREDAPARLDLLRRRRTDRSHYRRESLPSAVLREFDHLVRARGGELAVVCERRAIDRIARRTAEGARACLLDHGYLDELIDWLRLSASEATRFRDGFTPRALGLDPATAWVTRLLRSSERARRLVPRLGMAQLFAWQSASAMRRTGALLVLTTRDPSVHGFIAAGRALQALWIHAPRTGLALQPVHFPLFSAAARAEIAELSGTGSQAHATTLLRIGWSRGVAPASERVPVERFLVPKKRRDPE